MADPIGQNKGPHDWSGMSSPEANVPNRVTDWHRKTSAPRPVTHETHTVASQKQLEGTRDMKKVIPISKSLHPHLKWWLEEGNVLAGQPLHPLKHALQIFTDTSKEWWGTHLNEHTASGDWSLPESKLHINYLERKAVFLALEEFQDLCTNTVVLIATDNSTVVAYINKKGGMKSGPIMCPHVQDPDLVFKETGYPQSLTHPRPAECDSKQTIQAEPNNSNRIVSPSRGLQNNMLPVAPSGPVCHQIQQLTSTVCVTSSGPPGMGSGCTEPVMGGSGPIRLPINSHLGQSGGEIAGLPVQQDDTDCTRVAQLALVLGSSGHVQSDPSVPAKTAESGYSTIQPDPTQKSVKPESTCLAPRATAIKEQGFSEAVAA